MSDHWSFHGCLVCVVVAVSCLRHEIWLSHVVILTLTLTLMSPLPGPQQHTAGNVDASFTIRTSQVVPQVCICIVMQSSQPI